VRHQIEEEYKKRLAEEQQRLAQEQQRLFDAERKKIEEEILRRAEEERRKRLEDEQRQKEEERAREAEERRRREEELAAQRRREEEERAKYEEAVRQAIEEGRRLAQEKKIRAHLDRAKEFVAEAQFDEALKEITKIFRLDPSNEAARDFEQSIYGAREEHQRRQEEAERLAEEQQRKVAELQRRLEEQARAEQELEQRRAIREAKIAGCLQKARTLFRERKHELALNEIETVYGLDPGNAEGQELEVKILEAQKKESQLRQITVQRMEQGEAWRKEEEEKERATSAGRELLRRESVETYRGMLTQAWVDGQPTKDEQSMLEVVRLSLGIEESEHALVEREVQVEAYTEALRAAWRAGVLTAEDARASENLRQLYGVSMEEHLVIETGVRKAMSGGGS